MQHAVNSPFNGKTTAAEVIQGIDLTGKAAIITGATAGIGRETARALASAGARLILPTRNLTTGEQVVAELQAETGNLQIETAYLDLLKLDSVEAFAAAFLDRGEPLHILINNAGIMAAPYALAEYGFDSQMMVNCVSHMVLAARLAPALIKADGARIVTLTSMAHHLAGIDLDDVCFESREYDKWLGYCQSKTASSLLAMELHRRMRPCGVVSLAVHPGFIAETNLVRHLSEEEAQGMCEGGAESGKNIAQGAATTVWAATSALLANSGGSYLEDCQVSELLELPNFTQGVMPYAVDKEAAAALWGLIEGRIGRTL